MANRRLPVGVADSSVANHGCAQRSSRRSRAHPHTEATQNPIDKGRRAVAPHLRTTTKIGQVDR